MESPLGVSLKEAQKMYRKYLEAETLILSNQRYRIEDRELERANLEEVVSGKLYWEKLCYKLSKGSKASIVGIKPINL